jgi:processing peptidase subunit alpha
MALPSQAARQISLLSGKHRSFREVSRWYSKPAFSTYSSYLYPWANEPPEVKKTNAEEVVAKPSSKSYISPDPRDPFDDAQTLAEDERNLLRQKQRSELSQLTLKSALPILATAPSHVPSNVPADQLETPRVELSELNNGVRVVSQETYGQVSCVGVVCGVASRSESLQETSVSSLLEVLAFGSTERYSALQIQHLLQDLGATRFVNMGREQSLYCIDLLRPNVDKAMELLHQVLLKPRFTQEEVEDAKQALEYKSMDMPPQLLLGEALQTAAFGNDQQLGQSHFGTPQNWQNLSSSIVNDYWERHMLSNPQSLVIAGAGVRHEYLLELADKYFGHMKQSVDIVKHQPSVYRGGEDRRTFPTIEGLTHVAIGSPVGGWHSDDLVATCVLQTLLGGGNSFSAGGPGKGMYSRLYRQVLNRYTWAESAEAFTTFHDESGIFGISGSTFPSKAREMVQVFAEHLARLAVEPVSDEELDRARNMLKCNVLTQLESRLVLFEDLGRQILTYGKREDMHTTCERIDAVTKADLQALVMAALKHPPTIAAVGDDVSKVPYQAEVAQWFR